MVVPCAYFALELIKIEKANLLKPPGLAFVRVKLGIYMPILQVKTR